jgi:hypothetical protein
LIKSWKKAKKDGLTDWNILDDFKNMIDALQEAEMMEEESEFPEEFTCAITLSVI